jgi:hypothetical protein
MNSTWIGCFKGLSDGIGDLICIVMGCNAPLLLRQKGSKGFQVVGDCYVHGLTDSTGLLGPLPEPWHVLNDYDSFGFWLQFFHNPETGVTTLEDPRLGKLPPSWERVESIRIKGDPEILARFKNTITGEVINSDPRLCSNVLKERGVDLQSYRLI